MPITKNINFRLIDVQDDVRINNQKTVEYGKSGWFRIIDVSHSKKGLDFCIPLEYSDYSKDLQSKLLNLDVDDKICMRLKSINERNTVWIVEEII